jgi:hypothetical protein
MTVNDEGLGLLTWDDDQVMWTFEAGPVGGRSVRGAILPEDCRVPLAGVQLETVRALVRWVRQNEPSVREHLTAEMFDWWRDTSGDQAGAAAPTPEEFRARLTLTCVYFFDDGSKAKVAYELAGWILSVTVGPGGAFEAGANVFEPGALRHSWLFHEPREPG